MPAAPRRRLRSIGAVADLDHVQLAAPTGSERLARAFYGQLLGLRELAKPAHLAERGGVWFAAGDRGLHIGIESPFRPARKAHPALRVRGLSELRRRLDLAGVRTWTDEPLPGHRRFYAADPFGNRLEFLEPLSRGGSRPRRSRALAPRRAPPARRAGGPA